jgi:taurine transport system permease protein
MGPDGPEDRDRKPVIPEPPADPAHDAKVQQDIRDAAKADKAKEDAAAKPKAADDAAKAKADAKAKAEAKEAERQAKADAERDIKKREAKAKADAEALRKPPPPPPWWKTLRADPPAQMRLALALAVIAVVFGAWWLVTRGEMVQFEYNGRKHLLELKEYPSVERIISFEKMPGPGEVFGSFGTLWDDREFPKHLIATLQRVVIGVLLAAFFGVLIGIAAATNRGINAAISPLVIFLRSVPMGPLLPLTLLLFGSGEGQKSKFIFLAIVAFVFSDTVKAISIVPERYVETAQTLGASRWQIIYKVLVPLALPDIITSLRFQLGLGLGYITLAEVIDVDYGIGKLISVSERLGNSPHVWLTLFMIALVAFFLDYLLRTIQRGVFSWRKDL